MAELDGGGLEPVLTLAQVESLTEEMRVSRVEEAFNLYGPRLFKTAYRLTGNPADAEDLLQELFVKLYRYRLQWLGLGDPLPWMQRVLFNLHIDVYRKKTRTPGALDLVDDDESLLEQAPDSTEGPDQQVENWQFQEMVGHALNCLSLEDRALVVWFFYEGYTLEEIAELLGRPEGTIKARMHRLKAKLKTRLKVQPYRDF